MELNADFDQRVAVHANRLEWLPSPMPGVERRMLDRLGDEVARATSIVRYAPDSHFSRHVHTGGEEFFVLEGIFQDEHGDFPAGTYVRNPPGTAHMPGSQTGCVIFVKLWQFDPNDQTPVTIDTTQAGFMPAAGRQGVQVLPLFGRVAGLASGGFPGEDVSLERWQPGAEVVLDAPDGLEILVLEGGFEELGETFFYQSWLRVPRGARARAKAAGTGALVWIKRGHLAVPPKPPRSRSA